MKHFINILWIIIIWLLYKKENNFMTQINSQQQPSSAEALAGTQQIHDELILVVPREHIFADTQAWHGLQEVDFDQYLHIINDKKEFLPRSIMETEPAYKQIIPYLIFT